MATALVLNFVLLYFVLLLMDNHCGLYLPDSVWV